MSLSNTFNALVVYQLHSNPAILGLYSKELGYSEIALKDLVLTDKEIEQLHAAREVSGTFTMLATPDQIYLPTDGWQKVTWRPTSLQAVR